DNHTYQDHDEFSGGDGFTCAMSFMNRDVAFSTLYFGLIFRSGDRGFNVSPYTAANIENCVPGSFQGDGCGTFYTSIELYENPNDTKSTDSIIFRPTENLSAGDTINIPSATSQQFIQHVLTQNVTFDDSVFADPALTILDTIVSDTAAGITLNLYNTSYTYVGGSAPLSVGDTILVDGVQIIVYTLTTQDHYFATNAANASQIFDLGNTDFAVNVSWDTIVVQDVYQSWLALGLGAGEGVWLTRNGLRFSATHDGFLKGGGGISGSVTDLEFSKDGAHLYVGTSTGRFYRLSGIDTIYSPNPILGNFNGNVEDSLLNFDHPNTQATFELINSFGAPVLGINVDKTDPDIVVVALGGFGGAAKVQRSTDATTAGNFTAIDGNLPDMPCLSVVMDRENPNDILVGTEFGLYRTENGGGDWSYVDAPFGRVPIFDLMQNWRTWDEGCFSNGQMYVGTHGRGIWTTNEFLSAPEAQDNIEMPVSISNITLYPNPVITDATISFDVREAGKGSVKVFNLSGQLVVNMNDISLNAGNNLITLGLDELSTGTYIVKLTTDSESRTTKFIKH
ncbi:MAG: T9SS type A sorting domain-containing protein, partial [Crocinitomicaceae bacterium]